VAAAAGKLAPNSESSGSSYYLPESTRQKVARKYLGVLIHFWLFLFPIFLFAAQPKYFFLHGLKKLEQRSYKCVELRGEYVE
jgi:hypothetical protein